MIESILATIKAEMQNIGIPYEYMRWKGKVEYPYFVGEYTEIPTDSEDGREEGTLLLAGYTRNTWLELTQAIQKIKDHFPSVGGFRKATDSGVVVLFYSHAFPIDTGDAELKKIQINIDVMAWKGLN